MEPRQAIARTDRSPTDGSASRRYRSPLRAQRAAETRAAVIAAATTLFTTKGWAGTGMRDVAREAGVAVETVYSHYSSKRRLLDAVIDEAVVGDDRPVAVADRPEFLALGQGGREARVAAAAKLLTSIHGRTAAFAKLIREAAPTEDEFAELLRLTRERQRLDVGAAMALIIDRSPTDAERDGVWAIASPEVYLLLVDESGWPIDQYEHWVAETLARLLPPTSREETSDADRPERTHEHPHDEHRPPGDAA